MSPAPYYFIAKNKSWNENIYVHGNEWDTVQISEDTSDIGPGPDESGAGTPLIESGQHQHCC